MAKSDELREGRVGEHSDGGGVEGSIAFDRVPPTLSYYPFGTSVSGLVGRTGGVNFQRTTLGLTFQSRCMVIRCNWLIEETVWVEHCYGEGGGEEGHPLDALHPADE